MPKSTNETRSWRRWDWTICYQSTLKQRLVQGLSYPRYVCKVDVRDEIFQMMKWRHLTELDAVQINLVAQTNVWWWFPWQQNVSCRHVMNRIHVSFHGPHAHFRRWLWCWWNRKKCNHLRCTWGKFSCVLVLKQTVNVMVISNFWIVYFAET